MISRHPEQERAIAAGIRRKLNTTREHRGGAAVEFVEELDEIAKDHAEQMALHGELSHELNDTTPQERASSYSQIGENIHREEAPWTNSEYISRQTVLAWVNSPPHRRNMMREGIELGGVGVSQSGDWSYVCLLLSTGKKAQAKVSDRVSGWLLG